MPLLKEQEEARVYHPLIFQLNGYCYPSVGVGTVPAVSFWLLANG